MLVDPDNAWHIVQDLEGVSLLKGGSGEIEKKPGDPLTHISDALGYYINEKSSGVIILCPAWLNGLFPFEQSG